MLSAIAWELARTPCILYLFSVPPFAIYLSDLSQDPACISRWSFDTQELGSEVYRRVPRNANPGSACEQSFLFIKGDPLMPVLFIEAPQGIRPEAKRKMIQKLTEAIDEAYHIGDTLIFINEHSAENVAMDGRIQSENPKILEALKKINAGA
jgi:phenylpyruvate tautomerase PptA (4-oxalocrotonate tautomerase family)